MSKKVLHTIAFLLCWLSSYSTHIVGGELYYQCLSGNNYKITLELYRDGCPSCTRFDHFTSFYIYDQNNVLYKEVTFEVTDSISVPPIINNPCLLIPPDVIVWGIELDTVIYLPSGSDYYVVYQRCCRNNTIVNLLDPGGTGSTYVERIPDPGTICNSNPYFNDFPPIALCVGDSLHIDHSATDPDGDSLVYELCTPYLGADDFNPKPAPPLPPPYGYVTYLSPFSSGFPLDASPPLAINSQSGLLTGTPTNIGQYVVAVCVYEYRNGQLIGEHKRDFQFNIVQCGASVTAAMPSYVLECDDYTVAFQNYSVDATYFEWVFGDGSPASSLVSPVHTYSDTGVYQVRLIANPGWPCADTAYSTIKVYPGLIAGFGFISACAGTPVQFFDSSTSQFGNITGWAWNFGDGFSTNAPNPQHAYASGGNYSVSLTVFNVKGCVKTITKTVFVYPIPIAEFENSLPCEGDPVTFTDKTFLSAGSAVYWLWNFNNESTSDLQNPAYLFPVAGNYSVSLLVYSNYGCTDTVSTWIQVNPKPISEAGSDTSICSWYSHAVGTTPTPGYTYSWTPTAGLNDPSLSNPVLTWVNDSNQTIPVTYSVITTLNGCTTSDTVSISIFPDIRTDIPHQPGQCLPGNSFDFTAQGVYGGGASFLWDFGMDANISSSTNENPSGISFSTTGDHLITLSISDNGCVSVSSDSVTVYLVPVAGFQLSEGEGCDPLTIQFTDATVTDGVLNYSWNFGDGTTAATSSPVHTFSPDGIYSVTLTVELEQCKGFASMTTLASITVFPKPVAGFTPAPHETSYFVPVIRFDDKSSGAGYSIYYTGDGDSIESFNFSHEFQDTGFYFITQVVRNSYGCTDTAYDRIRILPEFAFWAPRAFTPENDGLNDIFLPKGIGIKAYELYIFDRWGDELFYSTDLANGWDGRANGGKDIVQMDVYVYVVKLVDVFEKEHRYIGRVSLVK